VATAIPWIIILHKSSGNILRNQRIGFDFGDLFDTLISRRGRKGAIFLHTIAQYTLALSRSPENGVGQRAICFAISSDLLLQPGRSRTK
jgi:hypothetical protein